MYASWESAWPYSDAGWIYADASAHRLVSDVSQLVGQQRNHRLIVAGDSNVLRGYGENGSRYWKRRYDTVFERLDALGLHLVGPFAGRRPHLWPDELPQDSTTTPTYRPRSGRPNRQLDFVFASTALAVTAINEDSDWIEDHSKIRISVAL